MRTYIGEFMLVHAREPGKLTVSHLGPILQAPGLAGMIEIPPLGDSLDENFGCFLLEPCAMVIPGDAPVYVDGDAYELDLKTNELKSTDRHQVQFRFKNRLYSQRPGTLIFDGNYYILS